MQPKFHFISLDGTRDTFDDSDNSYTNDFTDFIALKGEKIHKVETLLSKKDGMLIGFKWIGGDGEVIIAVGRIDASNFRNDKTCLLNLLTLNHNQRLVGVKSHSGRCKFGYHY